MDGRGAAVKVLIMALLLTTPAAFAQDPTELTEIVFVANAQDGIVTCALGYECSYNNGKVIVCKDYIRLGVRRSKNGYVQMWSGCENGWVWVRDEHGKRLRSSQ